jgi:hypothetical protein
MLIEWECTSLCYRAMYCLDSGDLDGFVGLLTEDGELRSALGVFSGRQRIREWLSGDRGGAVSRHVITNLHFVEVREDEAIAVGLNTSLLAKRQEGDSPFLDAKLFQLRDHYQRTAEGWRIRSRTSEIVFGPADWIKKTLEGVARRQERAGAS